MGLASIDHDEPSGGGVRSVTAAASGAESAASSCERTETRTIGEEWSKMITDYDLSRTASASFSNCMRYRYFLRRSFVGSVDEPAYTKPAEPNPLGSAFTGIPIVLVDEQPRAVMFWPQNFEVKE